MKVLITGVSGTGKSTIVKALREKGIVALDFADFPELCSWRNKETKERVGFPPSPDLAWFDVNGRYCDIKMLKELLDQHKDVVVGGVASANHAEYFGLFDKVILLQCDPKTVMSRMQTRPSVWDKSKSVQEQAVDWQKEFDPELLACGAIPINAEEGVDEIVEKIIALI